MPAPGSLLQTPGWTPENRRALDALVRQPLGEGVPVAALDLDHTCLIGDVSETLLALLDEASPLDLVGGYAAACAADLRTAFVELVFTLLEGRTEAEGRALAERALDEGARRGILAVRPALRELVAALHQFGWEVYVVSASPEVLVQAAAARVGIPEGRVIGMRPAIGPDGRYSRPIQEPIPFREGKLELVTRASGRRPTLAIGDSTFDLPLLVGAARALLLDRGDAALRAEALANHLWIQPEETLR